MANIGPEDHFEPPTPKQRRRATIGLVVMVAVVGIACVVVPVVGSLSG